MSLLSATKKKQQLRERRRHRIRAVVRGNAERPRLSVFRSNAHTVAQLIDDAAGRTLCAVRDGEVMADTAETAGRKQQLAFALGKKLAEKAKERGITALVFDRGGYAYHGRVKAVADGARSGGLQF